MPKSWEVTGVSVTSRRKESTRFSFGTESASQNVAGRGKWRMGVKPRERRSELRIIWRNPKKTAHKTASIVSIGRLEGPGHVQRFYRSSVGLGIFGTEFELWVNTRRSQPAA